MVVPPGSEERERIWREREQAAFEYGRTQGERALSEQLVRQRAELLELQNGVLTSLSQAIPRLIHESEKALVLLALEAVEKWQAGVPVAVEIIEAVVREAMQQTEATSELTVFLNPADLELLRQVNSPLLLPHHDAAGMRFQAVADVDRGGCRVLTRFGILDARREVKIELTKEAVQS
jgi:flagellar biosynthesis/type III secretory pathway protein FliH